MKIPALAVAAAVALGMIGAAPAAAQPGHQRVVVTKTHTEVHRKGWNSGHHGRKQVCRTVRRNHHAKRVCTWRKW